MAMLTEGFTQPLPTVSSVRPDEWRGLTSVKAGTFNPIAFIPLLREDRLRARATVQVRSEETLHTIVNPVRVRVEAFLIPKTVLERFQGSMEVLNRSYLDEPAAPGMGTTPKWFLKHPALPAQDKGHEIYDKLGVHWAVDDEFNTDLVESYNQLHNWMRKNKSPALPLAALSNTTCLPAFWDSWRFADVKPSFDAGLMEGVVPVAIDGNPPIRMESAISDGAATLLSHRTGGTGPSYMYAGAVQGNTQLYAELDKAGGTISLANIAIARETQQFAMMRDRYKSVPDEYLIDLLMSGIAIPDQDLRQPIRLATVEAVLGQTERYATDGASLDTSVANGMAMLDFTINTPPVNTGGVVMVCLSVVPEQLYERINDVALTYVDGTKDDVRTPEYVTDYLDPQKVEVVHNMFADTMHSDPSGIFGYAPLNYQWRRSFSRVGGKFKRPVVEAFVEDRQRIWSVEKLNPELSADFYMCPVPFPHSVFANKNTDPYEVICVVQSEIVGRTVFGPGFDEDMGSYDRIIDQIDRQRLTGVGNETGVFATMSDAPSEGDANA